MKTPVKSYASGQLSVTLSFFGGRGPSNYFLFVYQVSIVAASSCRYVYWQRTSLEYLFVKEQYLAYVVTTIIARDVTTKLYAMNNKIMTERGSHLDIRLPSISHALARSPRRLRSAAQASPPTNTVQPVPPEKRPSTFIISSWTVSLCHHQFFRWLSRYY